MFKHIFVSYQNGCAGQMSTFAQAEKRQEVFSAHTPGDDRSELISRKTHRNDDLGLFSKKSDHALRTAKTLDGRNQEDMAHSRSYHDHVLAFYNNDSSLPLYRIEHVPPYLRDNAYIITGYRAYYTTKMCLRSLFRLHNETFNIWTHLAGAFIFLILIIYLFHYLLFPDYLSKSSVCGTTSYSEPDERLADASPNKSLLPLLIFGFYSFACLMCMICSACYHTFTGHMSEKIYHYAHVCDYFGITFLVVGSFIPFCYYVFSHTPFWRNTYVGMIFCFGIVGMLGPFFRHWTSLAFANKKILFYVSMVSSGMLPILHIAFLLPKDISSPYVMGLFMMMVLYGIGVFFYVFKLPEVFYPGKFDVYFSSHQIWHMFVLAAALTHFFNCIRMYTDFAKIMCTFSTLARH